MNSTYFLPIEFFGMIFSDQRILPDPAKIEAIQIPNLCEWCF